MSKRRLVVAVVLAGLMLAWGIERSSEAAEVKKPGDGYPRRTISVIVPYGPGGGSDQVARAWAAAMQKVTGVGFQVENKPGGGGIAAMPDVMNRPKDGYTIVQQTDEIITAEAGGKIDFSLGKDLLPICITQATFSQIYIRPDEKRFTDWKSFVEYAKAHPGEVSMGNIGTQGSMEHVQVVALEKAAGIKTKQISFDKPSERYAALIGGHTDVMFEQPGDVRQFLEAKQMKAIITVMDERPSAFADVPSLKDAGLDEVPVLQRVRGFWIHSEVPEERRAYLEQACEAAFKSEAYQKFNKSKYMHLARSFYNSADATKLARSMVDTYKSFYKELGLAK